MGLSGFENSNAFSTAFRRFASESPSAYQRRLEGPKPKRSGGK
jgi:AraC-like DNA-binding protein